MTAAIWGPNNKRRNDKARRRAGKVCTSVLWVLSLPSYIGRTLKIHSELIPPLGIKASKLTSSVHVALGTHGDAVVVVGEGSRYNKPGTEIVPEQTEGRAPGATGCLRRGLKRQVFAAVPLTVTRTEVAAAASPSPMQLSLRTARREAWAALGWRRRRRRGRSRGCSRRHSVQRFLWATKTMSERSDLSLLLVHSSSLFVRSSTSYPPPLLLDAVARSLALFSPQLI